MYAIQWQRITGESGVYKMRFLSEQKANKSASALRLLDDMQGRHGEYEYNIVTL